VVLRRRRAAHGANDREYNRPAKYALRAHFQPIPDRGRAERFARPGGSRGSSPNRQSTPKGAARGWPWGQQGQNGTAHYPSRVRHFQNNYLRGGKRIRRVNEML